MLNKLIAFVSHLDGIESKSALTQKVADEFSCVKDRSVYYTNNFAIRFSQAKSSSFGNTVLSLSALQKYDHKPMLICLWTPTKNYLLLANTTFLSKISHSSQALRIDNIKGSFNGSDILREIDGIQNIPQNFDILFGIHCNYTFEENLERLVEATNNIVPTGKRFEISSDDQFNNVYNAPQRAIQFSQSSDFSELLADLNHRVSQYENEILVAALIENVKTRGNIIEYLIAGEDEIMRTEIMNALMGHSQLPRPYLKDGLGDYSRCFDNFHTETDIKTKIMILPSAPKGYNIDKMLEFLSEQDTVFLLYFVGINYESRIIQTKLVSMFHDELLNNTIIQAHWAGRNSRGVSQFNGEAIKRIILQDTHQIDAKQSCKFLEKLINL